MPTSELRATFIRFGGSLQTLVASSYRVLKKIRNTSTEMSVCNVVYLGGNEIPRTLARAVE